MKITYNWLKRFVDFDWTPEVLAERLTMLGLEVEGVEKRGGEFENIVVAQVLTCDKHPNADKLSVCRVTDGRAERQIVCGAKNFKVGDKVPLALPGCVMPAAPGAAPITIKAGKIRGVESNGMMCSAKELGIAEDAEGLLILASEALVGQPFAEHVGRAGSDVIYDLEITPNRPDLNSAIGIAREISALTGNPLRLPTLSAPTASTGESVDAWVSVRIDDPELCPRYVARIVRGVKVGPSPDWLKQALEKSGVRSINNVVDVTNYVMFECGQPLHAFDYHLLQPSRTTGARPTIIVRRALAGQSFTTLDGQTRVLSDQTLLIADEAKAIALAGVMGGQNSEIKADTVDVLVESACFKPQNVRATAKKLELRTDASYRFERGSDPGICEWASRRACQLIIETAGGQALDGVIDAYPGAKPPKSITLRTGKTEQLLGVAISAGQQADFLGRLGIEVLPVATAADELTVNVPSFRVDLKRDVDLIEEVGRLYGIDKIPATTPRGARGTNDFDAVFDQLSDVRRLLTGVGLCEAQGQTLISEAAAKLTATQPIRLQNPISADMNVLRPSLLPGLLDSLRHNLNRKIASVQLFEIGRVFGVVESQTRESRRVAMAMTGEREAGFWSGTERHAKADIFDLKGLLEEFLEQFGVRGVAFSRADQSLPLYLEAGQIQLGRQIIGSLGQLQPALARQYDLRDPVLLAELDLDLLLARRNTAKSFRALPLYPSIRRDVAMLAPEAVTHQAILQTIRQGKAPNLESVDLFDVFRGQNVPTGQKSMAYALTYRAADRTLTDAEVNAAHLAIVEQLKQQLKVIIRDT